MIPAGVIVIFAAIFGGLIAMAASDYEGEAWKLAIAIIFVAAAGAGLGALVQAP